MAPRKPGGKPSPAPKLDLGGVRVKIERAKRHIRDLDAEIGTFHARNPYEIIADNDPEMPTWRVRIREPIPTCLSGIIGDAVHTLRAALDQLAWQLVLANGQQPRRRTGFPIGASAKEFESDAAGKIKGVNARAYRLIRRLKPYKGGREFFWTIHELDRLDKHMSIIPVGAAHVSTTHNLQLAAPWWNPPVISPPVVSAPSNKRFPLEDGAALLQYYIPGGRHAGIHDDPQFTFDVAFGKGQIVEGESVIPTLQQLTEFIGRVIDIFERRAT